MKGNEKMPMQKSPNWTRVIWFFLIGLLVIYIFRMFTPADPLELPYSEFKEKVSQGKVSDITIEGDKLTGSCKGPVRQGKGGEGSANGV